MYSQKKCQVVRRTPPRKLRQIKTIRYINRQEGTSAGEEERLALYENTTGNKVEFLRWGCCWQGRGLRDGRSSACSPVTHPSAGPSPASRSAPTGAILYGIDLGQITPMLLECLARDIEKTLGGEDNSFFREATINKNIMIKID